MTDRLDLVFFILLFLVEMPRLCSAICCGEKGCVSNLKKSNTQGSNLVCEKGEASYGDFCLHNCPAGYYSSDKASKCELCHQPCATCASVQSQCTSCSKTFLTSHGSCSDCKPRFMAKDTSGHRIRLVKGSSSLEGRLEVYYNGSWGTVCDDGWNKNAADVVCRQLNLGSVIEVSVDRERFQNISNGYKNVKIWLSEIQCKGNEQSITQCSHNGWGTNQCSHLEDVGLRCSGPDTSRNCVTSCGVGYYSEKNRCLQCPLDCKSCDRPKRCMECVEMRFLEGDHCVSRCSPGKYGDTDSGKCVHCKESCSTCVKVKSSVHCTTCPPGHFLKGTECVKDCGASPSFAPYLRLSGNFTTPYEGLLEVRYKGQWHSVCNDIFGWDDARVFCREFGYGEPVTFSFGDHGASAGSVLVDDLRCMGDERSFVECAQRRWLNSDCFHFEDIGLTCSPPADGLGKRSRCVDKCDDNMFKSTANTCELCNRACLTCATTPDNCIACRESYFLNGTTCSLGCANGQYANVTLRTCLPCDASRGCMTCQDSAEHCLSCVPPLLHNKTTCLTSCTADMYRKSHTCVHGCGIMHYANESSHECHACPVNCHTCAVRKSGVVECVLCAVDYALDAQGCCVSKCSSGHVAAPMDPSTVDVPQNVRLVNGFGSKFFGRLEVFHLGEWGLVCDDSWSTRNAEVVCRELLLGTPNVTLYIKNPNVGVLNATKMWLDDVVCKGDEDTIVQCSHRDWGINNCAISESVFLRCNSPGVSKCQKQCPSGYVAKASVCEPCGDGCLSCVGSAGNCSKCAKGLHLSTSGTCLDRCPPQHYATVDHRCLECNSSCATCARSGDNCTSCPPPYILSLDKCVLNCSNGTFKRSKSRNIRLYNGEVVVVSRSGQHGLVCGWYLTLKVGNVICRQLNMGEALQIDIRSAFFTPSLYRMPILVKQPKCRGDERSLFECPVNKFDCTHSNIVSVKCSGPDTSRMCLDSCATNASYFVTTDGACEPCASNCLRCAGNGTNCTACNKDMYQTWDNKCVQYCPEGTYHDKGKNACLQCESSCLACRGGSDMCSDCRNGKYLFDKISCHHSCSPGSRYAFKRAGIVGMRLYGGENASIGRVEYLIGGSWATVCGSGWNMKGAVIVCRELGLGDPVRAFTQYYGVSGRARHVLQSVNCNGTELSLSECRKENTDRYTDNLRGGDENYTKCIRRRYAAVECSRATRKLQCVDSCGTGYYLDATRSECFPCSSNCLSCSGTADWCTACNDTSFMQASRCERSCPEGNYGNLRSRKCERCHRTCKSCINGRSNDRCASCANPYYLKDKKCVDSCFPDFNLGDLVESTKSKAKVRLVNGSNMYEGELEVFRDGTWGRVCTLSSFQANLACQELGYEGGSADDEKFPPGVPQIRWKITCDNYEAALANCRFNDRGPCVPGNTWVVCSSKPLDMRVCRKTNDGICSAQTCFRRVSCVDGNGKEVPKGKSFCMHCPKGRIGDGDICTVLSLFHPVSYVTSRSYELFVGRSRRFFCYGLSGTVSLFPDRLSWQKDGKSSTGYREHFTIRNAHHHDAGIYTCTLRNSVGSVSVNFNVTVVGPPLITAVVDMTTTVKSTVLLTCTVLADPPANITWYYKKSRIATHSHHGPTPLANGSLEIIEALPGDSGNYTCEATNRYGAKNETMTLRVTEELHFDKGVNSQEVEKGKTATFNCAPLSYGSPMKISWRKNGKALETSKRIVSDPNKLVISDVSQEDCGEYFCVAKNEETVIASFGTLAITGEPPCIHTPPRHLSLQVGMDARFYCKASGVREVAYTWEGRKPQHPPNIYEIKNVSIADVGVYICRAESERKVAKAYAFLSVDGRHACPVVTLKPKDTIVKTGAQATFRCEGAAAPHYTISWYLGDREVKNSLRVSVVDRNQTLIIDKVRSSDVGRYTCVVQSPYGQRRAVASLTTVGEKLGSRRKSSSNKVAIVVGLLVSLLFLVIVGYFVWRYRRDGSSPSDVMLDLKQKAAACCRSAGRPAGRPAILHYDTNQRVCQEDDGFDTSDTNPFVRD